MVNRNARSEAPPADSICRFDDTNDNGHQGDRRPAAIHPPQSSVTLQLGMMPATFNTNVDVDTTRTHVSLVEGWVLYITLMLRCHS